MIKIGAESRTDRAGRLTERPAERLDLKPKRQLLMVGLVDRCLVFYHYDTACVRNPRAPDGGTFNRLIGDITETRTEMTHAVDWCPKRLFACIGRVVFFHVH